MVDKDSIHFLSKCFSYVTPSEFRYWEFPLFSAELSLYGVASL